MRDEMVGVVFEGEGKLKIGNIPMPKIKNGDDVLIEVEAASICGTDVQILKVPAGHPANSGIVLGHEYSGKVKDIGRNVKGINIGDRVVMEPAITCGNCVFCKAGYPNMCEDSTTLGIYTDGGFAEYSAVPVRVVHKISHELSPDIAVFAEPLSCVVNAMDRLKLKLGDSVLVLGAGPIGLLFAKLLKASGAGNIYISEISPYRKEIAVKCGFANIIDPSKEKVEEVISKSTNIGVDVVVDCVGSLLEQAVSCVRKGGKVLIFGLNSMVHSDIKPYDIAHKEIEVIGSFIARYTFPAAIKILENRVIDVSDMITGRYNIKDFEMGLEAMRSGSSIKVIIDFKQE
ncbi:MAG: alcohol dehydrogenase catalytic domain-containing protein [Clostridiales bacterium]|nr:alcohol dehydrogenase catalytic domain-containing protein [Clostridiales bacterium]